MMAGIPVVAVTTHADDYKRFLSGEIDDGTYAKELVIRTDPAAPPKRPSRNVSYRRFDFSVGPTFAVELGQIDDAVRGTLNIVPQVETGRLVDASSIVLESQPVQRVAVLRVCRQGAQVEDMG